MSINKSDTTAPANRPKKNFVKYSLFIDLTLSYEENDNMSDNINNHNMLQYLLFLDS